MAAARSPCPSHPCGHAVERLALAGFLAGYCGLTHEAYELDLRQFASWCHIHHLRLFGARGSCHHLPPLRRADPACPAGGRPLSAGGPIH
jgi:hypothetical protein